MTQPCLRGASASDRNYQRGACLCAASREALKAASALDFLKRHPSRKLFNEFVEEEEDWETRRWNYYSQVAAGHQRQSLR
jgi:hypothetical protein